MALPMKPAAPVTTIIVYLQSPLELVAVILNIDFQYFIKELERISNKGYIELPSRLGDNLVYENKNDHVSWFIFDDVNNQLVGSKRNQLIDPFITVSTAKLFEKVFRESLVIELAWEDKIEYIIDNQIRYENFKKISFFKILRKHLSKKIRSIFK